MKRLTRLLRARWRWVGVLLAVLALVFCVDATRRVLEARRDLLQAAAGLGTTRATLGPLLRFDAGAWPDRKGYEALVGDVTEAQVRLERARGRLGYLRIIARAFRWAPGWAGQAAQAPRTVDLGIDVSTHALAMLDVAQPLFLGTGSTAERAREVMVVRHDDLDRELAALEGSAGEAHELQRVHWSGPFGRARPMIDGLVADLDHVTQVREMAAAAATGLDPLMGFDGPRTYVVLGQNEQEIRPTGGFVGTMGVIVVRDGRLVSSDYRSSYAFDPPSPPRREPPLALQRYMGAGYWYVRDANWDADFGRSAERILQFLHEDRRIDADGVIAVDSPMMRLLLKATGPLTVEGFSEPITDANFYTLLEEELFGPGGDEQARKHELLQPVLQHLIERVQSVDAGGVPPLLSALHTGTGARDIQMYSRDARVATLLDRVGVSGRMTLRAGHDFVGVVDSNISYVKIQLVIRREITYLMRNDGGVDLIVKWTNERSAFTGQQYLRLGITGMLWDADRRRIVPAPNVFGNYARIYLPPGTTFDAMTGFTGPPGVEIGEGFTVLSGLIVVRDGETQTIRVSYRLAGSTAPSAVDFWKQGGQTRDTLSVFQATGKTQLTPFSGAFDRDQSINLVPPPAHATALAR